MRSTIDLAHHWMIGPIMTLSEYLAMKALLFVVEIVPYSSIDNLAYLKANITSDLTFYVKYLETLHQFASNLLLLG